MVLGVMLPDQWGKLAEEFLGMFCDDTHYGSSGPRCKEGLEERFEIATLWGAFCGKILEMSVCLNLVTK